MPADASAAATDRPDAVRASTSSVGRAAWRSRRRGAAPAVEVRIRPATQTHRPAGRRAWPSGRAGRRRTGGAAGAGGDGLTERERRILAFEQQWWKHAGAKEQAIRDTFGLSATRYYQLLNALLDNPAALAAEPVLIGRLRRLRSSRARNRRRADRLTSRTCAARCRWRRRSAPTRR